MTIWSAISANQGRTWSESVQLSSSEANASHPRVASTGADFRVFWRENRKGTPPALGSAVLKQSVSLPRTRLNFGPEPVAKEHVIVDGRSEQQPIRPGTTRKITMPSRNRSPLMTTKNLGRNAMVNTERRECSGDRRQELHNEFNPAALPRPPPAERRLEHPPLASR
jgi:hypothetical protein